MNDATKNKIADAIELRLLRGGYEVAQARVAARDLANEIDGIIEAATRTIVIKHTDTGGRNVNYIRRYANGNVAVTGDSGVALSFGYAGIIHDSEGAKIAISRMTDGAEIVRELKRRSTIGPSGNVQYRAGNYELVA